MTHCRRFLLFLTTSALLALTTACTETEGLQTDAPNDSSTPHIYRLRLDMPVPSFDGETTRAASEWEDGSQIIFWFYTGVYVDKRATGLGGPGFAIVGEYYHGVSGMATYNAAKKEWLLEPVSFPSSIEMNDCEIHYYQPQAAYDNNFLTAVYYGTTTYSLDEDQILCGSISLKPTNWRLRFKGDNDTHLSLLGTDIQYDTGDKIHTSWGTIAPIELVYGYETDSIPLTVAADGYTPYIYGTFKNETDDNTITIETGGLKYTRTISGTALQPGETGYMVIPTPGNYEAEGWTLIEDKHTSATPSALSFESSAGSPQNISVTSNEQWTATSDATSWCTVSPASGSNNGTVKVTVTANTSTSQRTAHVTVKGTTSGDVTTVTVTQKGKSGDAESQAFTVTGNGKTVTFKMVRVEHGTFQMGATTEQGSDADSHEKPEHTVTLTSDYYMSETEVTQTLWYAVMGQKPTAIGSQWSSTYGLGDQRPAYYISWNDCQEFITKLNALTGKTFRMPTEAKWEFVARGGNKSKGYKYAGSNTIGDVAWYTVNSSSQTHDVATKQPNELGLYDMSGNVWEWCSDWYGSYSSSAQTNPTGPATGSFRVNRGGSWNYFAGHCCVSYRSYWDADLRYRLGLRLTLQ